MHINSSQGPRNKKQLNIRNLDYDDNPDYDEVHVFSVDKVGQKRKLNKQTRKPLPKASFLH